MTYSNNYTPTNNNQQVDWSYPRRVIKKAMTKARANKNGNGVNRGILIVDPGTNEEKWITVDGNANEVIRLDFGSWCWYAGEGNRPSLQVSQPQQTPPPIDNSQARADFYNRMADQPNNYSNQYSSLGDSIEQSYNPSSGQQYEMYSSNSYQPNNDYSGQSHVTDNTTINDTAIEKACLIMSNTHNMLKSMLPNVDDEEITKMCISIYISQTKSGIPF